MKTVLVTGASGFVGRHCLPELPSRGFQVHAISRNGKPEPLPGVSWHRTDVLDEAAVTALVARLRPTHLLHLAWVTDHGAFWTSPENVTWSRATLNFLQAFAAAGGQRVVVAGSCAEYDWRFAGCVEGLTPLAPATFFGACKHATQTIASGFAHQCGLSLAWGRLFFGYGPHEGPARLVPSVVRALLRGQPAPCTQGKQMRDFLFGPDIGSAFVRLLDSGVEGPINIASGVPVAVGEVALRVGRILGRSDLVLLGALPERPNDPPLLVGDCGRLNKELGWSPRHDLDDGLKITIDWWRSRPEGA
jgi:nucleoside-diphosphate-sugar epimerase